jgi:predicted DNA-binding transcriptional regulator AlpA
MEHEFIQPAEVKEITGLSIATLAHLRYQGEGPRFYKPTPRTVLYKRSEVFDWLESSVQDATSASSSFA